MINLVFTSRRFRALDAPGLMMRYALSTAPLLYALPQLRVQRPTTRISLICLENAEGRPEEALTAPKCYSNERKLLFTQHCGVA